MHACMQAKETRAGKSMQAFQRKRRVRHVPTQRKRQLCLHAFASLHVCTRARKREERGERREERGERRGEREHAGEEGAKTKSPPKPKKNQFVDGVDVGTVAEEELGHALQHTSAYISACVR